MSPLFGCSGGSPLDVTHGFGPRLPRTMSDVTRWTWAGDHLPEIEGQGVYFAAPADRAPVLGNLDLGGYVVVEVDGRAMIDARTARGTIAAALGLAETAPNNPDAFADSLTELRAAGGRIMLLWNDADTLLQRDLPGWTEIVGDLKAASAYLWDPENDDSPDNVVFETILLVDGYGVRHLS